MQFLVLPLNRGPGYCTVSHTDTNAMTNEPETNDEETEAVRKPDTDKHKI